MTDDSPDHLRIGPGRHEQAFVIGARGATQSYVDLTDPTHLEFPYVQRIAEAIDAVAPAGQPLRLVHLGGAGMTIPRYAAATRPGSVQLVLEPDEWMVALVVGHLPLLPDSGIEIRTVDGRSGMGGLEANSVDVVVLDAFDGALPPVDLNTVEAWREIERILVTGGTVVGHYVDSRPFTWLRRSLAGLCTVFPHLILSSSPSVLAGERSGNIVFVASQQPVPEAAIRAAAQTAGGFRTLSEDEVQAQFGGGDPFTDADPAG